ncbi:MAG TPA: M24 family metallopeptidase, partial [Bryobacteraceae bacterium]|nr:M24 family metallopeptidase [Bryobacteraceae bacterium]
PIGVVHRIEPHSLGSLPGKRLGYSRWAEQSEALRTMLGSYRVVAMQHSPNCAIPYVAMVDGGTIDLIRSFGIDVRSSADLVQVFEARWSENQLQSHLQAGAVIDKIRADAFALVADSLRSRHALSEFTLKQFVLDGFSEHGLATDHGPIVAVNGNASDPHYEPTQDRSQGIQEGDLLLLDMWAKFLSPGSVYYDITWTAYCGSSAPDKMQKVFGVVSGARDAAVDFLDKSLAAGLHIRGFQVDDAARKYIEQRGYGEYFFHRTGHSIGEEVHGAGANMDNYETHDERRIVQSTCFSIEPGVYLPDFGIRSEVNVFVEAAGGRVTGEKQHSLLTLI